jgi:hypothetical protein
MRDIDTLWRDGVYAHLGRDSRHDLDDAPIFVAPIPSDSAV